jgi:ABC-type nitrate/sulfonate/bicarbonate transport system substrate-binding protein
MEEAIIKALMKADGGDPSKVSFLNLGEQDFFTASLRNIDFAWVFEGWTVREAAVRSIALDYLELRKFSPVLNWYTPVLAANQNWLDARPGLARAFLRALDRGYRYAIGHPAEAAGILLQAAPELNAALVRSSQDFLAGHYQAQARRWGEFDPARWNGFVAWMQDNGLVKGLDPAARLFTNDYLPPAAR